MYPVIRTFVHKSHFTPNLYTNYDKSEFTNYVKIEKEPRLVISDILFT